jgi:hypothetical protein
MAGLVPAIHVFLVMPAKAGIPQPKALVVYDSPTVTGLPGQAGQ